MFEVESTNSIVLNRFFTRNTFKQLIDEGSSATYSSVIRRYIMDESNKTNGECISEIYCYLKSNYQNEYYYKNTLLNKLLLGIHSPKTTIALTEVPIAGSKADFILINGKAVVYEIKTALDNFERLEGQLEDYYKAFSRVVVVTAEQHYEELKKRLKDSPAGIYVLTSKGTLSIKKEPIEYTAALSKTTMFKILRKGEYENIIKSVYGKLPKVTQFEYYRSCQVLFESLSIEEAYKLFTAEIKKRSKIEIDLYSKIPYELKFLTYFSNYRKEDYTRLLNFLSM